MHRRPLGGGRTLAAIGGLVLLVGCVLPWWVLEQPGGGGLPPLSGNGLEGSGILCLLAGIATLLLIALPYAVGDRPTPVDRWEVFALVAAVGWLGFGLRIAVLIGEQAFRFTEPVQVFTNGPGIWLTGIGLAILSRAVYVMTREPHYR